MGANLDRYDLRILDVVQDDVKLTHAEIGERVGLSGSAVRRRLETLRNSGVIRSEVALLDSNELGALFMLVLVTFERRSSQSLDAFRRAMTKCPQVRQCYSISGAYDFLVVVQASTPEAYVDWNDRVIAPLQDIRRLDTYVICSTVKFSTKFPLLEPRAKSCDVLRPHASARETFAEEESTICIASIG